MQRQLSILSGSEHSVVMQQARDLFQETPQVLWITQHNIRINESSRCIPAAKSRTVLGHEFYLVIFDAWSGLNVNALATIAGTIRAGGVLVLLTPPLEDWSQYPDPDYQRFLPHPWQPDQIRGHFLQRLVRMLEGCPLMQAEDIPEVPPPFETRTTDDQIAGLSLILEADSPVVLNADRGRGKSAVLGMAAQQLIDDGKRVVLTAPSRATVDSVFKHAERPVDFYAPDDLLQSLPTADVLLVDEAAAIPVPMLVRMLRAYPRCVFSTTLQGYEGSGRGFVLRFQKVLDEEVPGWQSVQLFQPIRWEVGDWLEGFVNQWLVMDGEVEEFKEYRKGQALSHLPSTVLAERFTYTLYPQSKLVSNESKLREIFNLLVNAHYQTRPSDLRQLLDAPQISIHALEWQQKMVAVALLSSEGGLGKDLVTEIYAGKRRPHGHLLAQSLTFHAGISGAACLKCERVMRIAVHPGMQRQGLGTLLLGKAKEYAIQQQADYLGVSYALSPGLLGFWRGAGFVSVRLGFRKDTASGSRSLMQVKGLSEQGVALSQHAQQVFQSGLPGLLDKLGDVPGVLADEFLLEQGLAYR